MAHLRALSLRRPLSLPSSLERRFTIGRPCRGARLFATRVPFRRAPLSRRTHFSIRSFGQDTEFERAEESGYRPAYTDSLSYALVNAFTEMNLKEQEALKPLPTNTENLADDPSLGNPLERMERMGTGWFGAILDFEGVVVQSAIDAHKAAWTRLAEEEGKALPLQTSLQRAALMKAEQAIAEVFCWGREPSHVRRLALRKEELFRQITRETALTARCGLYRLLETLKQHNIPVAICSTERQLVYDCIQSLGLCLYVDAVISADDVSRCAPDPEAYGLAAQRLNRPPFRCVVIGASNHSCEAAHDCGMKFVATATSQPLYELNAADLVIKKLDELSFVNLKQLFRHEECIDPQEQDDFSELPPPPLDMPMFW